jgi:hypothetical protein
MPAKKTVKTTAKKRAKKSAEKPATKPAKKTAKKPAGNAVKKTAVKTASKKTAVKKAEKPVIKKAKQTPQQKLRDTAWEIGQQHPSLPETDHIALLMINPHQGHVYWHVMEKSLNALREQLGKKADHASFVVRIYDITDIIFDGVNAHRLFELDVSRHRGSYYFSIERTARNYLAEAGIRCQDGSFHALARSSTTFFDQDRPSDNYCTEGLFVKGSIGRSFSVENFFDAPLYEKINRELAGTKRDEPLSVATVLMDISDDDGHENPVESFIREMAGRLEKFGGSAGIFSRPLSKVSGKSKKSLIERVTASSQTLYRHISSAHKERPFHIVHCHDWYSSKVGLSASKKLNLPMVFTLHSTEQERSGKVRAGSISAQIGASEKAAVKGASLVIVPRASTRQQVIDQYHADPDMVVVIPHAFEGQSKNASSDSSDVKRWFGLNQHSPIVLFAGEISHAAGADIMVEAIPTVSRNHGTAQFVFAGEGPLKGELESRVHHTDMGNKCRFVGDLSSKNFQALLMASDFVVIPARTWQDEGLARMAIENGKPVLTTQQAGIGCVTHGENGLVTFDNPGSIVWGMQELLANPLHGSMLRIVARKSAGESGSFETVAAQHYMHYKMVLKKHGGKK